MNPTEFKGSAIYCFTNKKTGNQYIGSAINVRTRYRKHLRDLEAGKHHSYLLRMDWKGGEDFDFTILEVVPDKFNLIVREQWWIDNSHSYYNICKIAGSSLGVKRSAETREKSRLSQLGMVHSEERRRTKSIAQGGENHWTKSKVFSLVAKKNMKAAQKNLYKSGYTHPVTGTKKSSKEVEQMRKVAARPVLQFNKEGLFIKEWESRKIAGLALNITPTNITANTKNKCKTAGGFVWKNKPEDDPYLEQINCVNRLYKEYEKHQKLIIATDFDSTVYDFEKAGTSHMKVIQILKECSDLGFYIVIYTASAPNRYAFMKEYLESRRIKVSAINENPIELPYGNSGKIYFNILLDDRAGLKDAYEVLQKVLKKIYDKCP